MKKFLKIDFSITYINEKLVGDITGLISYLLSNSNNKLVFHTLDKEIKSNPTTRPLLHSDCRFQYTSKSLDLLNNCIDFNNTVISLIIEFIF